MHLTFLKIINRINKSNDYNKPAHVLFTFVNKWLLTVAIAKRVPPSPKGAVDGSARVMATELD
jgi:hypothetical protein